MSSPFSNFIAELKRRRVFRVAAVYAGIAFILIQVADITFPALNLPDWTITFVLVVLLIGFPITVGLAWAFDITSKGVVKTPPKEEVSEARESHHFTIGNKALAIIAVLAIAVAVWALLRGPSSTRTITSIAVLPLENLMNDPNQDYFVDGMTEALISELGKISALRVISRTSVMQYKAAPKPLPEIARELDVDAVVEGSVLRAGNQVRITAQLLGTKPERHLWTESYNRDLQDVLSLHSEVARAITREIKVALTPEEEARLTGARQINPVAYDAYLKARQEAVLMTEDGLDRAMDYLQKALIIVGEDPVLYAAMGYISAQYVNIGVKQEEDIIKAMEYAGKALELDPESAQGHMVLGMVKGWFLGDSKGGYFHLKRALTINPNDQIVLSLLVTFYSVWGKIGEGYPLAERLVILDPLTPRMRAYRGLLLGMEGRSIEALEVAEKYYQIDPTSSAIFWYALGLASNQRFEEACSLVDEHSQRESEDWALRRALILCSAIEGETREMDALLSPEFTKTMKRDPQYSWQIASFYALAGEKVKALDWLENAVDRGFINYPFLAEYDPFLESIRNEDRFQRLMERVRYEWEHFDD
jgi:TolB-like protein